MRAYLPRLTFRFTCMKDAAKIAVNTEEKRWLVLCDRDSPFAGLGVGQGCQAGAKSQGQAGWALKFVRRVTH